MNDSDIIAAMCGGERDKTIAWYGNILVISDPKRAEAEGTATTRRTKILAGPVRKTVQSPSESRPQDESDAITEQIPVIQQENRLRIRQARDVRAGLRQKIEEKIMNAKAREERETAAGTAGVMLTQGNERNSRIRGEQGARA